MSGPEAAKSQPPDGLSVIATIYGAELSLETSINLLHGIVDLDAKHYPWTRAELGEYTGIEKMRVALGAVELEKAGLIEEHGRRIVKPPNVKATQYRAAPGLVDAAVDFNLQYFGIIEEEFRSIAPRDIKWQALGRLAATYGMAYPTDPADTIYAISNKEKQRPLHTVFTMLRLFVTENDPAGLIDEIVRERVQTHPSAKRGRRHQHMVSKLAARKNRQSTVENQREDRAA